MINLEPKLEARIARLERERRDMRIVIDRFYEARTPLELAAARDAARDAAARSSS